MADKVTENLENCIREDSHKLLRAYGDSFTKNIYATHDNTYKNLKSIINDRNIVVSWDKGSYVVIMNHNDYFKKLQHMIDEGIENGVYIVTEYKTLEDL